MLKEHHETKQEITIKPFDNDGNLVDYNVRADEITNDFFNEVKASDTAPYTQNQKNGGMIKSHTRSIQKAFWTQTEKEKTAF